jgi:multicomponent Na+:H+ antiporter subunit G
VNWLDMLRIVLLAAGVLFFTVGTIGLMRFSDVYTRLHALTKVDNIGLGLIVLSLALGAPSLLVAAKLMLIWLVTLAVSAVMAHLVAQAAAQRGIAPRGRGETGA